ncbi:MAG: hypothetical protein J6U54_15385 [Clostridiales bacterium]|nr:hypothetical protein [Clostridiales bacterium]
MELPIKSFTVYAQLRGKRLYYGTTFISLVSTGDYKDGIEGFFTIQWDGRGFVIAKYLPLKPNA